MDKTTTLNDLKQKEREARKALILNAAVTLFSTNPVANVSIRDIAKEAGVSPALIYRHFKGRDELFVAAFMKHSEKIVMDFNAIIQTTDNSTPDEIGVLFVKHLLKNDDFIQMMTHVMLDAVLKDEMLHEFNDSIRKLLAIFDRTFENSGIRDQVRLHSQALFSSLNGIVITYRNFPGRSQKETEEHISRLASLVAKKLAGE